jgi:hypothetical protein
LLSGGSTEVTEINGERNPIFPGIRPEPISVNLTKLSTTVREQGADVGLATDGDADRIRLLKSVSADERGWNLAGDGNDRHGIHMGVGNAGGKIGRARSRGCHTNSDLSGCARVSISGVRRGLLVPNVNGMYLVFRNKNYKLILDLYL